MTSAVPMDVNALLPFLQAYTQALQTVIKAFTAQQQALMAADAEAVLHSSQAAEAGLASLQQLQQEAVAAQWVQQPEALRAAHAEALPTQVPQVGLLADMVHKQQRALQVLHRENQALIQQAQQLNEAQLEALVALHQNTEPVVYGAQGDNTTEFQSARSAYDFSA